MLEQDVQKLKEEVASKSRELEAAQEESRTRDRNLRTMTQVGD